MTPAETVILVRFVKAMCPAQLIDEYTPQAWHLVIGDLRLVDCQAAVVALKRGNNPPPFLDVGVIRDRVRVIRNDRIDKAAPYEPDSGLTELEWRRLAADGVPLQVVLALEPRDMRAIEGATVFRSVDA